MSWLDFVLSKTKKSQDKANVDRKAVVRAHEQTIVPVLRAHGFETFRPSHKTKNPSAWRHREKWVDAFELFFVRAEERREWNTNTFSFSLTVGRHFLFIPYKQVELPTTSEGLQLPYSIACELTYSPKNSIKQRGVDTQTIWHIDPTGKNLEETMASARRAVIDDALVWLSQWDDLTVLLKRLLEECNDNSPLVWQGFGGARSPLRNFLIGFTALELGQYLLAISHLQEALDSKAFASDDRMPHKHVMDNQIQDAIVKARAALKVQ